MCAAGSTRTQLSSSLCEDNWGIPLIIAVFCVDWSGLCKIAECCCAVAGNTLLKRLLLLLVIGLNSLHFLKERILSWSIVVYSEIIDQWMNYSLSFQFSFSSVKQNISIYYRLIIINSYFWRLFKKEVSSIHLSSGVRGVFFFLKKETIEEFLVYMDSQKILIYLQKQQQWWRQSQPLLLHFIWNSSILKGRLLVINPSHFHTLSLNII